MKVLKVPVTVEVSTSRESEKKQALPFAEYVEIHVDNYGEAGKVTPKMGRQSARLLAKLEGAAVGANVELETDDYDLLKAACEKVSVIPRVNRQLTSYFDAIENAVDPTDGANGTNVQNLST